MSLSAGTRIGPYEILSPLGAGGMGEVYRARDGKLNRDVAIKVLPEAVAEDAERLARFQREAQVLAALNHPHIAAIYGLEKSGNLEALVLELVEGETLAEKIAAGSAADRRGARDRAPDRGRARGGAREGDRAPGPEAGQREGHAGGQGQGARLRPREGADGRRVVAGPDALAHAHGRGDAGRRRHRDGGVHVARAGARAIRGQARRHLGVRRGAVRDALGAQGVRGRDRLGHARRGAARRHRLGGAAARDACVGAPRPAPLPRPRSEDALSRRRRRAHRDGRGARTCCDFRVAGPGAGSARAVARGVARAPGCSRAPAGGWRCAPGRPPRRPRSATP